MPVNPKRLVGLSCVCFKSNEQVRDLFLSEELHIAYGAPFHILADIDKDSWTIVYPAEKRLDQIDEQVNNIRIGLGL